MSTLADGFTRDAPPLGHRPQPQSVVLGPISEANARLLGAVGVAGIAVVHILDAAGTYQGTRYIFWLYMAVIVAAIPVAGLLMHWASPLAWLGAVLLAVGPFAGYVVSRSIGLPGDSPDIGAWLDTLGMVSLFIELSVISLGLTRLALHRRSAAAPPVR
jgi:hypothetical protein